MITPALAIDALWFEPGTPADAAQAINAKRARVKWVSPAAVRRHWAEAQKQGRLPPLERPENGFTGDALIAVRRVRMVMGVKAA